MSYQTSIRDTLRAVVNDLYECNSTDTLCQLDRFLQATNSILTEHRHEMPEEWTGLFRDFRTRLGTINRADPGNLALDRDDLEADRLVRLYDSGMLSPPDGYGERRMRFATAQAEAAVRVANWLRTAFEDLYSRLDLPPDAMGGTGPAAIAATAEIAIRLQDVARRCRTQSAGGSLRADFGEDIAITLEEASRCYENRCHIAVIALCGRALEGSLRLMLLSFEARDANRPAKNDLTLHELAAAAVSKGIKIETGTVDLIRRYRNMFAHAAKGDSPAKPSRDTAMGVAALAVDVIEQILALPFMK